MKDLIGAVQTAMKSKEVWWAYTDAKIEFEVSESLREDIAEIAIRNTAKMPGYKFEVSNSDNKLTIKVHPFDVRYMERKAFNVLSIVCGVCNMLGNIKKISLECTNDLGEKYFKEKEEDCFDLIIVEA